MTHPLSPPPSRVRALATRLADRLDRLVNGRRGAADDVLLELTNVHGVVAAAIGKDLHAGLNDVVHAIRDHYHLLAVGIVLIDDEGAPVVGGSTQGDRFPVGQPADIMEPGPLARALRDGGVHHSTDDERDLYRQSLPERDTIACVGLPGPGRLLGALVLDKGPHPAPLDDRFLHQLADLLSLVVTSGRALQRESKLAEEYRALDQMKTDFVAVASHELRTPLTAIRGSLETLVDRGDMLDDGQRRSLLEASLRQTLRLGRLVDDLRTVSATDAGDLQVSSRPFDLTYAVEQAVQSVRGAVADGLLIESTGPDDAWVVGDVDRFIQVLENLVRNARDHGSTSVEVGWSVSSDRVQVSVTDDGPGVPPDLVPHLFDRFTRGRPTERHSRGIGLGLAIARELVEAMGGELRHDATWTPGARFTVGLVRSSRTAASPLQR